MKLRSSVFTLDKCVSPLAFLGHFWSWMGIVRVARWIRLEILNPKHMRESKIGLLEQIWASKRYHTFFWVTLYIFQSPFSRWKKENDFIDEVHYSHKNSCHALNLMWNYATIMIWRRIPKNTVLRLPCLICSMCCGGRIKLSRPRKKISVITLSKTRTQF